MQQRIARKWRPPLAFVLGGTLAAVFFLPLLGISYFRLAGNVLGWGETAAIIAAMAFAATALLGYFLWRLVLRPVRDMTDYARAVAQADETREIPEHFGTPEFRDLSQSVIDMGRVLMSREAVLRGYADHVTHELKSPLTVLRGAAELLDTPDLPETERRALLGKIDAAADRMTALLDAQRALARASEPRLGGACRISELHEELQRSFPAAGLTLLGDAPVPLSVEGLRLVLDHLLANATAHGASEVLLDARDGVLCISDNGSGISEGNRSRIFDPFFTTRRETGGTGMGLPIVRRILEAHGARIELLPNAPGAAFQITF